MALSVITIFTFLIFSTIPSLAQRATEADIYGHGSFEPVAPAAIYALYLIVAALVLWAVKDKEARPTVFYIVSPMIAGQIAELLFSSRAGVIIMVGLYLFYIFGNWKYPESK